MVMDIDANGDGMVTENELHSEFVIIMDTNQGWFLFVFMFWSRMFVLFEPYI